MEEFVENFQEFREWLNNTTFNEIKEGKYNDIVEFYEIIKTKFDELGLNDAF